MSDTVGKYLTIVLKIENEEERKELWEIHHKGCLLHGC